MVTSLPESLVSAGREANGRFGSGNGFARGNPHAQHVARLRSELMQAVTPEKMRAIVNKLIELAEGGDLLAIREILLRTLGKPQEADLLERMERLEELMSVRGGSRA